MVLAIGDLTTLGSVSSSIRPDQGLKTQMPTEKNNIRRKAKGRVYSSYRGGMPLNGTALQGQLVIAKCGKAF